MTDSVAERNAYDEHYVWRREICSALGIPWNITPREFWAFINAVNNVEIPVWSAPAGTIRGRRSPLDDEGNPRLGMLVTRRPA